jgi:hypothetical protein
LAAVRLFTQDAALDGYIDAQGGRLSDVLELEDLISVSSVPVAGLPQHWMAVERSDMLIVVPPPLPALPALRRHRVKRPIEVKLAQYVVRGLAHLIAGIDLDPYLARTGQHFLPVTDASISSAAWPELEERHPVVLVNIRAVDHRAHLKVEI